MEQHLIILKDDYDHALNVWFWGYTYEEIQKFLLNRYSSKGRWTSFKILN